MGGEKIAFVTEGTASRCREICVALARAGYAVAFTYSGDARTAEDLKAAIEAEGVRALAHEVKKFDASELSNAVIGTAEELGGADLLVYFGDMPEDYETEGELTLDLDETDWDEAMDRGVRGFFLCCKFILPYLISRPGARIVAVDTKPHDCGACNLAKFVASRALHAAVERISTEMSFYGVSVACKKISDDFLSEIAEIEANG